MLFLPGNLLDLKRSMNAEFNKRRGIVTTIVVAVAMLLFYSYLIGLDLGKCTTYIAGKSAAYLDNISWAHFSFDNFLDNCHRLVEFVMLYLIPMVLPWLLYFIFRPTTKIRYWLFVQMGVALFLFVAIPFSLIAMSSPNLLPIRADGFDYVSFPDPFEFVAIPTLGAIISSLSLAFFLPIFCAKTTAQTKCQKWSIRATLLYWVLVTCLYPLYLFLTVVI